MKGCKVIFKGNLEYLCIFHFYFRFAIPSGIIITQTDNQLLFTNVFVKESHRAQSFFALSLSL